MLSDEQAPLAQYKVFTNNPNIAAIVFDVTDSISYFLYFIVPSLH
jgi:hypothetical protein